MASKMLFFTKFCNSSILAINNNQSCCWGKNCFIAMSMSTSTPKNYCQDIYSTNLLLSKCHQFNEAKLEPNIGNRLYHTSSLLLGARAGTKARKFKLFKANQKKNEEYRKKNPPPIPHKVRLLLKLKGIPLVPPKLRYTDEGRKEIMDDIYFVEQHKAKKMSMEEIIYEFQLSNHPEIFNQPDALVYARIELDMRSVKKGNFMDNFERVSGVAHSFDTGIPAKRVIAFCSTQEQIDEALANGAKMAGGENIIESLKLGEIDPYDIDFAVSTPDFLTEMNKIKGILKDKLPSRKNGTMGMNIGQMTKNMVYGLEFKSEKPNVKNEPDYGIVNNFPIGNLKMAPHQIEENLQLLVDTIEEVRPARKVERFITRILIFCPPSLDKLDLDHKCLRTIGDTGQSNRKNDEVTDEKFESSESVND